MEKVQSVPFMTNMLQCERLAQKVLSRLSLFSWRAILKYPVSRVKRNSRPRVFKHWEISYSFHFSCKRQMLNVKKWISSLSSDWMNKWIRSLAFKAKTAMKLFTVSHCRSQYSDEYVLNHLTTATIVGRSSVTAINLVSYRWQYFVYFCLLFADGGWSSQLSRGFLCNSPFRWQRTVRAAAHTEEQSIC